MPNGSVIRVDEKFEKVLKDGHDKMQEKINKKITFMDYTEFLAKVLRRDIKIIIPETMTVRPIKKGRRAETVKLEIEDYDPLNESLF